MTSFTGCFAMTGQIVTCYGKPLLVQKFGDMVVSARVFAKTMYKANNRFGVVQWPISGK